MVQTQKLQHEIIPLPPTSNLTSKNIHSNEIKLLSKFNARRSYSPLLASQIQRAQMIDNALQSSGKQPIYVSNEPVSIIMLEELVKD
jgi:hypothetical protein